MKKLVDMKQDRKELEAGIAEKPVSDYHEEYPWGLRLDLNDATLEKLGIKKLPGVGDRLEIRAVAKVQAVRQNQNMGEKKQSRNVELQICKMAVSKPSAASAVEAVDEGIEAANY